MFTVGEQTGSICLLTLMRRRFTFSFLIFARQREPPGQFCSFLRASDEIVGERGEGGGKKLILPRVGGREGGGENI